ncbi:MAG TPA: YIP1 family protein [Vicinamibacteria bacterium]|nr:YIP1 family protein [Vicinamibacteria bacterium]
MALCPHCHHALPDSPAGLCPNCGGDPLALSGPPPLPPSPGVAAAPPLRPSPARPSSGTGAPHGPGIPWDDRDRIGLVSALVETTREVLTGPGAFFRAMPLTGGLGSPLLYAVIVGWIGLVASAFYQAIFRSVVGSGLGAFGAERPEIAALLGWVEGWAGFVAQAVFGGVFVVIGVFVAAGILHLVLLLLGGARRDFEATFRVVSFAQATSILFLVPFCGQFVGGIWTLVLYVLGLAEAHQIGHGKATAAVLLPIVLLCCCCAALVFLFAGAVAGLVGQMQ